MAAKRPWRPQYTKDWRTDPFVRSLDLATRCVYFELIDIEWDENGLDPAWVVCPYSFLCNSIGCHWRTFKAAWTILERKYTLHGDGRMRSRRVQDELRIASELSQERSKAAKTRWERYAKGMLTHTHTHTQSHTPPTPSGESGRDLDLGWFTRLWSERSKVAMPDAASMAQLLAMARGYHEASGGTDLKATAAQLMDGYAKMVAKWSTPAWTASLFIRHWESVQANAGNGAAEVHPAIALAQKAQERERGQ